ncbi:MAG: hypothetical protein AAGM22_33300 [Acidobacteriota bacterium]
MDCKKLLGCLGLALATGLFSSAAAVADESCGEVYAACQQQLDQHARCAASYPEDLVSDASAIFELRHRVETSGSVGAFGPDPASTKGLERVLEGVLQTADASLNRPGAVETVLMGDLHRRHAERLSQLLTAPKQCDAASLDRLERSCRAGVGEVKAITKERWPSHVATCTGAR